MSRDAETSAKMTILLDFYGELLTERQRQVVLSAHTEDREGHDHTRTHGRHKEFMPRGCKARIEHRREVVQHGLRTTIRSQAGCEGATKGIAEDHQDQFREVTIGQKARLTREELRSAHNHRQQAKAKERSTHHATHAQVGQTTHANQQTGKRSHRDKVLHRIEFKIQGANIAKER